MEHTLRLGEGITRLLPPADTQLILIYTPNIPLTVRYLFLLTLIKRTNQEHLKIKGNSCLNEDENLRVGISNDFDFMDSEEFQNITNELKADFGIKDE